MNKPKHPEPPTLARRTVIKAAGAGLLAGIVAAAAERPVDWSAEYWAKKAR
jgi:hypothetical protein